MYFCFTYLSPRNLITLMRDGGGVFNVNFPFISITDLSTYLVTEILLYNRICACQLKNMGNERHPSKNYDFINILCFCFIPSYFPLKYFTTSVTSHCLDYLTPLALSTSISLVLINSTTFSSELQYHMWGKAGQLNPQS